MSIPRTEEAEASPNPPLSQRILVPVLIVIIAACCFLPLKPYGSIGDHTFIKLAGDFMRFAVLSPDHVEVFPYIGRYSIWIGLVLYEFCLIPALSVVYIILLLARKKRAGKVGKAVFIVTLILLAVYAVLQIVMVNIYAHHFGFPMPPGFRDMPSFGIGVIIPAAAALTGLCSKPAARLLDAFFSRRPGTPR